MNKPSSLLSKEVRSDIRDFFDALMLVGSVAHRNIVTVCRHDECRASLEMAQHCFWTLPNRYRRRVHSASQVEGRRMPTWRALRRPDPLQEAEDRFFAREMERIAIATYGQNTVLISTD